MADYRYEPDTASPPGATIKELLTEKGMSQSDFALRMDLTEKTVSQIINGIATLSYDTANRLELVLGVPARFWNAREAQYREALLRIEECEAKEAELSWLSKIPIAEMIERNVLQPASDKLAQLRNALAFFNVSSVKAWEDVWLAPQVQFRGKKAHDKKPGYVAAWMRLGEIKAAAIECKPYDKAAFLSALEQIRPLTAQHPDVWQPKLRELCAAAGVAVVLIREFKGASVSGITRWLTKDKAMIQLSLRYKADDQFWFSFFHEACHVLKHGKLMTFYEDGSTGPLEQEADEFACNFLIPPSHIPKFALLKSSTAIKEFAAAISIAPGIVVGRLQHDGIIPRSWFVPLKKKYTWKAE